MLTISQPLSSGQAQTYHAEEFTSRSQAYYAEGDNVCGEWQGHLAEELELRGAVRDEDFKQLSEGRHPRTGEQLVEQRAPHSFTNADGKTIRTHGHRAAWDATFSAPKSVSLTALVGGDTRVREAHREAVRVAVDRLERYVQARIGGNRLPETARKWAVAKFEHDTSRPVGGYAAPQLHTHAVFFNVTKKHDGTFRAIQPKQLYRSQQYATAVYRAELAWRVRQLGYEVRVEKNGSPEIKGYSQDYVEANSPRSRQIREHLQAAGRSGAAAAQIAAHRTREGKTTASKEHVRDQHRQVAKAFGDQPALVVKAARERGLVHRHDPAAHARTAVTYARDKTFEREAVVDKRDLMKEALKRVSGNASLQHVEKAFAERRARGDFVSVEHTHRSSPSRAYTTPAMIEAECKNIDFVRNGRGQFEGLASDRTRDRAASAADLNHAQRTAIQEVLSSGDRVVALQGIAGAGKTTTLRAIKTAAERDGYRVEGLAPTSRATAQLEQAGITSKTLQRHLAQSPSDTRGPGRLYVVDESSLASTRQVRELFERLTPQDRVLMVGDSRQHQAVDAGRAFQQLQQAGMQTAKLDEVVRQRDPELKQVVTDLAKGRIRDAISQLQEQGRIHEVPDRSQRLEAIARDYAQHQQRTLVVAPDNQTRQELNSRIREGLKQAGSVSGSEHRVQVLTPRQDMTGADRAWAARYNEGDVIRYTKGSSQHHIKPGDYATVKSVDVKQNTLRVELKDQRQIDYDPRRLRGVAVYEKAERTFAEGDRIQMTAPHPSGAVANRELGTVTRIDSTGAIHARMDSGRTAVISGDQKHVDHGYAVTSHSAQGATADRVLIHAESGQSSGLVNQRFAYVAGSRMRDDVRVYTDDSQKMTQAMERHLDKSAAVPDRDLGKSQGHGSGKMADEQALQQVSRPSPATPEFGHGR